MGRIKNAAGTLNFEAWDVTETHSVEARDVQATLPVSAVAASLAGAMSLPLNVPWGLRRDDSEFLDDNRPIGDQIEPDSKVTITPKTHLG